MGYAFELFFDRRSEAPLRDIWAALKAENLFSDALSSGSRPHISLAVCDHLDTGSASSKLDGFCSQRKPFELHLSSIGVFPSDSNVVFVAPAIAEELIQIHRDFHASFGSSL